MKAAVLLYTVD